MTNPQAARQLFQPTHPDAKSTIAQQLSLPLVVLMGLVYLIPGLIGHDPWKADEPYSFGIIYHIIQSGDWIVPTVAGAPFMEKPPLYYLTAAYFARLFTPWLPLHDAARLASGLFTALTFLFVGLAGREAWGKGKGVISIIVLGGCLGLVEASHQIITDVALLAGFSVAFYGLLLSRRNIVGAGILLGTGVGVGFLSKGLIAPGLIGLIAFLLPVCFRSWRNSNYVSCLLIAFAAAFPWLTIWPLALYQRSPELFREWLWVNNIGRYLGFAHLGADSEPWFYTKTLPWFAFPALPLASWAMWARRRQFFRDPAMQLFVLALAVAAVVLGASASARGLYALPLLIPAALLAAKGLEILPSRVAIFFGRFNRVFFGAIAAGLWLTWIVMMVDGRPPAWTWLAASLPMDFQPSFELIPAALAIFVTALWFLVPSRIQSPNVLSATSWFLGVALTWGLLATLWLPWIDAAKSYRSMFVSMRKAMPLDSGCLASRNLGESERAMLEYRTARAKINPRLRFALGRGQTAQANR
jgi:4-amino-4-deoxy-L-arabinose transferase-like glycosyltransferase